jgi:hypothetical protein
MDEVEQRGSAETEALARLAQQINEEHRAFKSALTTALERGIHAGELLVLAKSKCQHGTWLTWLAENFEGASRTAQEYMRLYNHRDELRAKYAEAAHLSVSGALKELASPREVPPERELEAAGGETEYQQALSATYKSAVALREIAGIDPERLAGAIAMLSRTHDDKGLREVLGLAWENAFQEYKRGVCTDEEEWRLRTLRAVAKHVRPVDLLPGRGRFAFEDELTYREMHTTFAELIAAGHIVDYPSFANSIRVMRNLRSEGFTELAIRYADALLGGGGTVRPEPEDKDEDEGDEERNRWVLEEADRLSPQYPEGIPEDVLAEAYHARIRRERPGRGL